MPGVRPDSRLDDLPHVAIPLSQVHIATDSVPEIPPEVFYSRSSKKNHPITKIFEEKRIKRTNYFHVQITQPAPCTAWLPERALRTEENKQMLVIWREQRRALAQAQQDAAIDEHIRMEVDRRHNFTMDPRQPTQHPGVMKQPRPAGKHGPSERKQRLTEDQQIEIVKMNAREKNSVKIGEKLRIPPSTVRAFLCRLEKTRCLHRKPGRPRKPPPPELVQELADSVTSDPFETVRAAGKMRDLSAASVKRIRNIAGIRFYRTIPTPALTPVHIQKRLAFARRMLENREDQRPIVFSDESQFIHNRARPGVWRKRSVFSRQFTFTKEGHSPISVMIWGAVAAGGYRSRLLRCPDSVKGPSYKKMLDDARVREELDRVFGAKGYRFQQDNAPPHTAARKYPEFFNGVDVLEWPAKSPDLNPIEHLWGYLKMKLIGHVFTSPDELFDFLSNEWNALPTELIDNYCSSFTARLEICVELKGECLNGHWKAVHAAHHRSRGECEEDEIEEEEDDEEDDEEEEERERRGTGLVQNNEGTLEEEDQVDEEEEQAMEEKELTENEEMSTEEEEIREHLEILREVLERIESRRNGFDLFSLDREDAGMMLRAGIERARLRRLELSRMIDEGKPDGTTTEDGEEGGDGETCEDVSRNEQAWLSTFLASVLADQKARSRKKET
jgi:hypothetical protein